MEKAIEKLNDLIALDIDAVNAYESAIKRIETTFLAEKLREFQGDHRRHIRELSDQVQRLGGKPREKPDVKGFFIKGFTAITSMMGDEGALKAMKGNEQLTTKTYHKALEEEWTAELRMLIEGNYRDEQRHLAFIEQALENRSWEGAQPSAP